MDYLQEQIKNDPTLVQKMQAMEIQVQNYIQAAKTKKQSQAVISIPVVVHIVWNAAAENISDDQVTSQIAVLNEDYRKLNADASNVPAAFQSRATDSEIEFCLANIDPNGNPTTGITRTQSTKNSFTPNNNVKYTSQGGEDAWDPTQYLNIWTCNLGTNLLGYSQFPGTGIAATDGVVIHFSAFGSGGSALAPYDKGRTTTHEVGHWLNLYHIWGDANCGDDLVNDTPTQQTSNAGCPTFPSVTCSNGPDGDMFMNYMDYVNDVCMDMFTAGQAARMSATMNGFRSSLLSSGGCQPTATGDAGISAIVYPTGGVCTSQVSPVVKLINNGTAPLTSVNINYQVDGGGYQTYGWSGNLASGGSQDVTLPAINVSGGQHQLDGFTSSPNGLSDSNTGNDFSTALFNFVIPDATEIQEDFENTFPPSGWYLYNPDNDKTWEATTLASTRAGSTSMMMNSFDDQGGYGKLDYLLLRHTDFTYFNCITFDLAYAAFSSSVSDTLEVIITTDCGANYTTVYKKSGIDLTTSNSGYVSSSFIPNSSEWRNEFVDLNGYTGSPSVLIAFKFTGGASNNLFIDNVNVASGTVGIPAIKTPAFSVFPNPAKTSVSINMYDSAQKKIGIYNCIGEIVEEITDVKNTNTISLEKYSKGIYFIKINSGDSVQVSKLIVE